MQTVTMVVLSVFLTVVFLGMMLLPLTVGVLEAITDPLMQILAIPGTTNP